MSISEQSMAYVQLQTLTHTNPGCLVEAGPDHVDLHTLRSPPARMHV